jgi:sulfur carrier protein
MSRRLDGGDHRRRLDGAGESGGTGFAGAGARRAAEASASPAPERTICVELNGSRADLEQGATVADAVEATGADSDRGVAVAVDGEVVPRSEWETTRLEDGQRVEVLRAAQGG